MLTQQRTCDTDIGSSSLRQPHRPTPPPGVHCTSKRADVTCSQAELYCVVVLFTTATQHRNPSISPAECADHAKITHPQPAVGPKSANIEQRPPPPEAGAHQSNRANTTRPEIDGRRSKFPHRNSSSTDGPSSQTRGHSPRRRAITIPH